MRLRVFQRYVVSILQCVYRTCVIPFTIHIGRNCCKSKKKYFCFKLAIPIIYTYISIRVPVDNPNNRDQDYLYPSKDYYNENYYKLKHKESQRYGEPIKLNRKRKFILLWNSPNDKSFYQIEEGNRIFRKNRCPYNNCFITRNKHVLSDIRYFDAIVFGLETTKIRQKKLPKKRSPYQKYIFYSTEPPQMNPACDERFHNFFNWTWTYKLDSDIRWGLVVRDSNGAVVGPKQNMKWISANPSSVRTNSESENKDQEILLSSKYLAAAWIASNEWSFNSRDKLIAQLKVSLSDFDLKLDFIGSHGRQCKENNENITCDDVLEKFYYFYLAFEKAMSVDYVTPILLHAFQHNTVPIVYGGGDYTRYVEDIF